MAGPALAMMIPASATIIFTPKTLLLALFFFFQAKDGIRDKLVTGVQTCALPISRICDWVPGVRTITTADRGYGRTERDRETEERRVGKECRSRWSPYH